MITPLLHDYCTTTGALPHASRRTTGGNGMEGNGREWKGKAPNLTSGLWFLSLVNFDHHLN
jgi:hypothetical protein